MDEKSRFYPDEFGWWELPEIHAKCGLPLHLASGQDFPFCPNCVIDNANAKRGREALAKFKERLAHHERMTHTAPIDKKDPNKEEPPQSPFTFGMSL